MKEGSFQQSIENDSNRIFRGTVYILVWRAVSAACRKDLDPRHSKSLTAAAFERIEFCDEEGRFRFRSIQIRVVTTKYEMEFE